MNKDKSIAPLWLELKTDYIDTNFDRLVEYLDKNKTSSNDKFFEETLNLLHNRVEKLIQEISQKPLYEIDQFLQDEKGCNKEKILFYIKLLGIFLLSGACKSSSEKRIAYSYQQLFLSLLCSTSRVSVVTKYALKTLLSDEVSSVGYNWKELMNDSPDLLSERILNHSVIRSQNNLLRLREDIGTATIKNGSMAIYNCKSSDINKNNFNVSLSVADKSIEVYSLSADKLKKSQQGDVDAIYSFTGSFLEDCRKIVPVQKKLLSYDPTDKCPIRVRIIRKEHNSIIVKTIDPKYETITGELRMNSTFNYKFDDCIKYLAVGYDIDVRLGGITRDGVGIFDMSADFKSYIMDELVNCGDEVLAKALCVNKGNTMWITDTGYIVYTQQSQFSPGTFAKLQVQNMNPNGYVYASFLESCDESFDEQETRKDVMISFCFEPTLIKDNDDDENKPNTISTSELAFAAIALYVLQKKIQIPSERYQMLCTIGILCKMSGNDESVDFVDFMSQYLRCCIYFVQSKYSKLFPLNSADTISQLAAVKKRKNIIEILRNYEKVNNQLVLDEAIDCGDELLSKLAKIVQSCNHIRGILSESSLNVIKREITKMLSIADDTETDLDEENGAYYGNEDIGKEFKTSFVYPPNNSMQAAPTTQHKNIFKAVCGFLNSTTGGTLYLGVNDLGYVVGIQQDMDYLKIHTIDEYMRHIQDEAKKVFGLDVLTFIHILPLNEDRVVALQITPCEYKIITLDGKAYIRINAETREMDEEMRIRTLSKKKHFDKDIAKSEYAIMTAIEGKRKAILHGYSSSNGGDCRDRRVEPFAFAKSHKHVWCFDLDDFKNKLFSISRISNVEILDENWTRELDHKELNIDIFNMIGATPIHIIMHLDTMAKNLLVEEYVVSSKELMDLNNGFWQLETDVYSTAGIGRFYIGLAEHIQIIQGEELKEYAKKYFERIHL